MKLHSLSSPHLSFHVCFIFYSVSPSSLFLHKTAYRTIGKTRLTKWLYDKTRCIFLPIYGGFPVKLRTFIGEPIPYDPNITAVELAERAKTALENLRDKHQKRPGNILRALSE
ncbi:monoacylglycerol/Diacylglycerol O-acyltransferase-like [Zootoca vivipara]|uniref:monoacylglycerol/Diacylglycerol O-acyltransferase-like n=1 Tax=Zootoca vivipara TaxID=8524 RepID=UPI00293B8DF4|nr:monoacylglycerol/Diacylglycerol O-acyltransferase-like [Zootoca vivipara]